MVLIVRSDLRMGPGKIASQCAHAAVTLAQSSGTIVKNMWMLKGQPKIVLKADNENVLNDIHQSAIKDKLNACLIRDAGRTQVESGTLTVLGIGPNSVEDIDKLTKHLKLL